jgi:hypothetical protein
MTTLTGALTNAFISDSTNNLREIANYSTNRLVRAATFVLISQLRQKNEQSTVLAKCINRLRTTNAPLQVLDLTPDQDGWKEAMFSLARWADEQSSNEQATVDHLTKELEYSHDLLRDCLRALNRLDAYEGLCDQIRRVLYAEDGEE